MPSTRHQDRHSVPFNPTVVRLGLGGRRPPGSLGLAFQSHCGAIGTRASAARYPPPADFQSHCGAIGTPLLTNGTEGAIITFNPTVVRLGPGRFECSCPHPLPFNPTVVRLGLCPCARVHLPVQAFNPTVVRLGHVVVLHPCPLADTFNPTVVRLGRRRSCASS